MRTTSIRTGVLFSSLLCAALAGCGGGSTGEVSSGSGSGAGGPSSSSASSSGSDGSGGSNGTGGTGGAGGASVTTGAGGSGAGGAGQGGAAPNCTPEGPFDGEPVTAAPDEWTWVPVPEAKCRTGVETGFGVRLKPGSDKLFIYLEGGGACFNNTTCLENQGSYSAQSFTNWTLLEGKTGVFNATNAANPLKDWNAVYVPYCTGDVHAGDATGVDVPGALSPKQQSFVGYANIGHFLKRIVPTFPGIQKVLLTGISAGGFGAFFNFDRVAQAFCPKPVLLIDDSGPPMSDTFLTPCLQSRLRSLWNLNSTLPKDCVGCIGTDGGGLANATTFLRDKYSAGRMGLISSDKDAVISIFFGYGKNECAGMDTVSLPLTGPEYTAALTELRDVYMAGSPAWSTYYVNNIAHTYLGMPTLYTTTVKGVKLTEWVGDFVNDGPSAHVAP